MHFNKLLLVSTTALAMTAGAPLAWSQSATSPAQTAAQPSPAPAARTGRPVGGIEEVTVTARRRSERAQTTPVAITAFSSAALTQKSINQVSDLNVVVPGFRFSNEGGKNTNDVILRGLSRIPLGEGTPAVVTYFADVPLPGLGSNIPVFDLSNIQVLKGPQGTLFGRNTLGGAVLLSPTAPSDKYTGYIDAEYGNFSNRQVEGAINVPIVPGILDVRVAGHYRKEDGYVDQINGSGHFSNINENAYRISVLFKPTNYIRSTTIYDYLVAPENAFGGYLLKANPGQVGALSPLIDGQLAAYAAEQKAAGPQHAFGDDLGTGKAFRRLQGVLNDTRLDVTDDLTVRNIVGYRKAYNNQAINSSGTPVLSLFGVVPFTVFNAKEIDNQEYLTDEVQVLGKSFNNRLNWIVGAFYNHDDSLGGTGSNFIDFSSPIFPGYTPNGTFTTSHTATTNYALYAQGGYDLSGWLLDGLTFNAGFRYSWDKVHACGGSGPEFGDGYVDSSECEAVAAEHILGGPGDVNAAQSQPSWTVGFDYKYSPKQFFYIVSRRGFRSVNVNTPFFSSPYTTGGIVVPTALGGGCSAPQANGQPGQCPDLRPFQKTGPEKLTDVEIGSKSDFTVLGRHVRFDIDGYYSRYTGALQFFNVIPTGIFTSAPDLPNNDSVGINAADENILGAEMALTVQPVDDVTVTLSGNYNNAEVTSVSSPSTTGLALTKNQITLPSPLFAGTTSITWTPDVHPLRGDLVLNGDFYYSGHFGAQYGKSFPGYGVGNVRFALNHIENTGLDLAVFAKNIANRNYLIGPDVLLNSFPVNVAYYAPPRQYGVELRYGF